jgi:hypothetical protein
VAKSDLKLRIIGPDSSGPDSVDNEVPAAVLLQALEGLQQLVWQFAFRREGGQIKQRLKLSGELKNRFALMLRPAEPGSYLVRGRVGQCEPPDDLVVPLMSEEVVADLTKFCDAAVKGNRKALLEILPDRAQRVRALDRLRTLAPLPGSGYRYELQNSSGPPIELTETLQAELSRMTLESEDDGAEAIEVVTGKLVEISFDDHNLKLLYAPTRRTLTCEYDEAVEPLLFENRRDLIQVRGKVRLGLDNHPEKIVEADYIGDLDLSPFVLRDVEYKGVRLRFRKPRVIQPKLDETQQLICLEDEELNLSAHARLRPELFEEVRACLYLLWTEYAKEPDEVLDPRARDLKLRLLSALEEIGVEEADDA